MPSVTSGSAEAIARAVANVRDGRVIVPGAFSDDPRVVNSMRTIVGSSTVVDVTSVYEQWIDSDKSFALYEDSEVRPPWLDAVLAWRQHNGQVAMAYVIYVDATDVELFARWQPGWSNPDEAPLHADHADHVIDWDVVQWVALVSIYVSHGPQAMGPLAVYKMAVNADGSVQDVRWMSVHDGFDAQETDAIGIVLIALTFLNCRNVTITTPIRPRAEARRIARHNVTVEEIRVQAIGRTVQGQRRSEPGEGVPLSIVRGHKARYGIDGRGKLFGKYTGTFWIPSHVRGSAEHGVGSNKYVVEGTT